MNVKRLYSLDALRGVAALCVVLWHWQHFYPGSEISGKSSFPYYSLLFPFYEYGWLAVEFFFCLSGFVFFWLYADSISSGGMKAGKFFRLRFSRLYPLHLLTLTIVGVLQYLIFRKSGSTFIYQFNDAYHLFLNLIFAQAWGFQSGESFNGPTWSVSIEILLYVFFFLFCLGFRKFSFVPPLVVMLVGLAVMKLDRDIGRGVLGFFSGGLAYTLWMTLGKSEAWKRKSLLGLIICSILWVCLAISIGNEFLINLTRIEFINNPSFLLEKVPTLVVMSCRLTLIPLTVFFFALHEVSHGSDGYKLLSPLGDMTYSSYLLHFPLQALFFLLSLYFSQLKGFMTTDVFLIFYFSVLLVVSYLCFRWFEIPMQRLLRKK